MRWRDIRFEKPTDEDKSNGHILQKLASGRNCFWPATDLRGCVAWMPLGELPQPELPGEIPDGWPPVDKAVDERMESMYWDHSKQKWVLVTSGIGTWSDRDFYIVPIEQPAPQYRPFASAAEFAPHADRWILRTWKGEPNATGSFRIYGFDDKWVWHRTHETYRQMFDDGRKFADDGSPFGVLISPAEAT